MVIRLFCFLLCLLIRKSCDSIEQGTAAGGYGLFEQGKRRCYGRYAFWRGALLHRGHGRRAFAVLHLDGGGWQAGRKEGESGSSHSLIFKMQGLEVEGGGDARE